MSEPACTDYAEFAGRLADAGRKIIRERLDSPPQALDKHDGSPVTAIDQAVEDQLRAMIQIQYPGHGITGEERGDMGIEREFVWAIDPVDGTLPLLAGIPVFGTLIALLHQGRPVLGIIDMPVTQQRWLGIAGQPTLHNNQVAKVRACPTLAAALMSASNPDYFNEADEPALQRLRAACRWTVYGGSCLAYGQIANGFIDLGLDVQFAIHDYLALVPVIQGAGGIISDWKGNELNYLSGDRIIAAGDPRVHAQALKVLEDLA